MRASVRSASASAGERLDASRREPAAGALGARPARGCRLAERAHPALAQMRDEREENIRRGARVALRRMTVLHLDAEGGRDALERIVGEVGLGHRGEQAHVEGRRRPRRQPGALCFRGDHREVVADGVADHDRIAGEGAEARPHFCKGRRVPHLLVVDAVDRGRQRGNRLARVDQGMERLAIDLAGGEAQAGDLDHPRPSHIEARGLGVERYRLERQQGCRARRFRHPRLRSQPAPPGRPKDRRGQACGACVPLAPQKGCCPGRLAQTGPRCEDAARLDGRRHRACLHRLPLCRGELGRPHAPGRRRGGPQRALHLSAVARGLLHLVDVLRLGRARLQAGARFPHYLPRPDADDRARLSAGAQDRAAGQGAEHHLDRRLHRRALRQEPGGGGDRDAVRGDRRHPLHRAAVEGGVVVARHHARLHPAGGHDLDRLRRPRLRRRRHHGGVRRVVRHAPHRRHRAPARPDAGDRYRVADQARRLPGGGHLRHLLPVRRAGRPLRQGGGARKHPAGVHRRGEPGDLGDDDGAVVPLHRAVAAPVPRDGGGEQQRAGGAPRRLAVPALPRADQSVRGADRACRPRHLPRRQGRLRHVHAGAAARRRLGNDGAHRLHRRPVGGHRHGDRGERRRRHHGVERSRSAVHAAPAAGQQRNAGRHGGAAAQGAACLDLRRAVARVPLLPPRRRGAARADWPPLLRRGGAIRPGVLRRSVLAPRHGARRHRRPRHRRRGVGLHAAAAELRRLRPARPLDPRPRPVRHREPAAAGAAWRRRGTAHPRGAVEPRAQHIRFHRRVAALDALGDRAAAGEPLRRRQQRADGAHLPLALGGDHRRADRHRGALPRRGADAALVRLLRARARHHAGKQARGRFPPVALRRAHPGFRDRRRLIAPRALPHAAQGLGVEQGRAQAPR